MRRRANPNFSPRFGKGAAERAAKKRLPWGGNIADGAPQAPFNERLSSVVFCRAATAGEALLGVSFPRADERLSHLRHSLTSLA